MASERGGASGRETRDLLIIGLIATLIVVWAGLVYFLVGDRPREWDYGSQPYIPAESYRSTEAPPPAQNAPTQVELPPTKERAP